MIAQRGHTSLLDTGHFSLMSRYIYIYISVHGSAFVSWIAYAWNAKCSIFSGNLTPKTSNYCPQNSALGFPGGSKIIGSLDSEIYLNTLNLFKPFFLINNPFRYHINMLLISPVFFMVVFSPNLWTNSILRFQKVSEIGILIRWPDARGHGLPPFLRPRRWSSGGDVLVSTDPPRMTVTRMTWHCKRISIKL